MENKTLLKIVSIILFILGIASIVTNTISYVSVLNGTTQPTGDMTVETFKIAALIALILSVIGALINIFLGVQGIRKANGNQIGKAAHIIGIIILVCEIISVVAGAIALIQAFSTSSLISLILSVIEAAGLVVYVKGTK
jgi:hypothetical protein